MTRIRHNHTNWSEMPGRDMALKARWQRKSFMIEPYYNEDGITIYNADCRDVLPQLEPVDLVLTDPPYGIEWNDTGYFKESRIFHQGVADWDNQPSPETFGLILSKAKESIVWGGNYFASSLGSFVAPLVWDKQNGTNRFADGEIAWTSFKSGTVRVFRHQWWGFLKESERGEKSLHPTQKPLALMKWCIVQAGDVKTILDPFMGSGTTLLAARAMGASCIGIEMEEKYCAIAVERLRQQSFSFEAPASCDTTDTSRRGYQESLLVVA